MKMDRYSLYGQKKTGNGSWAGHRQKYEKEQDDLRKWVDLAIQYGCPYNLDANRWIVTPAPKKPDWALTRDIR